MNVAAVIASAVIFTPCQSATPRTWVGTGLTPPADAAASGAASVELVGQAGMVMPGMLPQLAIGLADAVGFAAAGLGVAAPAHPAASGAPAAAAAAAAIEARARRSGRRNRLSVGM